MANITRIKAADDDKKRESSSADGGDGITRKVTVKAKKSENKKVRAEAKKAAKKAAREGKKVFILFRPFVALGRYIRDSFAEMRQVRWPDRKSTWKMTLSVIFYVILVATFIMLVDALFTFLFNQLLSNV